MWRDTFQQSIGESFGAPYELPADRCYCETCAAIGSLMWNWRLLLITGEARYADLFERTLYNGVLPSPGLDGASYLYVNPLQVRGGRDFYGLDYADTLRRWDAAVRARAGEIGALGFDERFLRLWRYYLGYCEAGFRTRRIDLMQVALQRG